MKPSEFEYLLNAFESASQSDDPAANGYGSKRVALFEYVVEKDRKYDSLKLEIERLMTEVELLQHEIKDNKDECSRFHKPA